MMHLRRPTPPGQSTRTVARFEEDHYPDEAEAKIKANVTANVKEKER